MRRVPRAVYGFLMPNFLGFLAFTVFPVVLSLWMAFTNWTLKPALGFEFLGLRNFTDLLGVRPLDRPVQGLWFAYMVGATAFCLGIVGTLWSSVAGGRGTRLGGVVLTALGIGSVTVSLGFHGGQGKLISGLICLVFGLVAMRRDDMDWGIGCGALSAMLLAAGAVAMMALRGPMWTVFELKDPRFWQYFYNTVYLMLGIPFSIAGSLALALLLNDELRLGESVGRVIGAGLCLVGGAVTLAVIWETSPDLGLLGAVLWGVAALGFAANVVSFRTLFYLPSFTAGVALMILWKALYNPDTGPINVGLKAVFETFGVAAEPPKWLASVEWAKPALIMMGVWTGLGGTNMLLYLAGLSNVPRDLLDAAEVDGAGAWARFRHVTWPQLAPTTFFISIMSIIGGLQGGFDQARVMTGGGPAGSTTTLSYYVYNKAFQDLDLGYAAAISWVLFAMIFVATAINWRFGRELEVGP
ncbi:MAG TPA: sugar ABC transporter permease [Armatimonadota bacterium]|nr:sugar ABC transporter permease [Armatimonadota bacterium]